MHRMAQENEKYQSQNMQNPPVQREHLEFVHNYLHSQPLREYTALMAPK